MSKKVYIMTAEVPKTKAGGWVDSATQLTIGDNEHVVGVMWSQKKMTYTEGGDATEEITQLSLVVEEGDGIL